MEDRPQTYLWEIILITLMWEDPSQLWTGPLPGQGILGCVKWRKRAEHWQGLITLWGHELLPVHTALVFPPGDIGITMTGEEAETRGGGRIPFLQKLFLPKEAM